MRPVPCLLFVLSLVCTATPARRTLAFGGTARELERQGNFVVTNRAGFVFSHRFNDSDTQFTITPALDYFVIPNLSLGGAVGVTVEAPSGGPTTTTVAVAPDVGGEFAFSDTWSVWPTLSLPMAFPIDGNASVAVAIFVPFLVHPAEHFFFGIGPGFAQVLTSHPTTEVTGGFLIGGYFDH
jgi:hypothetical protein